MNQSDRDAGLVLGCAGLVNSFCTIVCVFPEIQKLTLKFAALSLLVPSACSSQFIFQQICSREVKYVDCHDIALLLGNMRCFFFWVCFRGARC